MKSNLSRSPYALLLLLLATAAPGARAQSPAPEAPSARPPAPSSEPAPAEAAPVEAVPTEPAPVEAAPEEDPFAELEPPPALVPGDAPEDDLFKVEAVQVVGSLSPERNVAGSAYVVDEKALEKFNFDDATQVLSQVPGVYVRTEDGYGLRPNVGMRGADSDRSKKVTLLEDGILFGPAPYSAPAAYYFPQITRMTSVVVLKGAPTIAYGPQTIGGVLDLRTRAVPDTGPVAGLDASLGNTTYNKDHVYVGYGSKHWGVLAEGLQLYSGGFKKLDGGGSTGFNKQEAMLKARVNTDPAAHIYQRAELKFGFAHEDSNETYTGLTDQDFRASPVRRYAGSARDRMRFWRSQAELSHTLGVGQHFELRSAVYRHDFDRLWRRLDGFLNPTSDGGYSQTGTPSMFDVLHSPEDPQNAPYLDLLLGNVASDDARGNGLALLQAGNHRSFVSHGVQTVGRYDVRTGKLSHVITAGVRLHRDSIDRYHSARALVMAQRTDAAGNVLGTFSRPEYDQALAPLADNDVHTLALAAHALYDLRVGGLTLSPGVRNEYVTATYTDHISGAQSKANYDVPLFSAGALYDLTDRVSVLAGVQQGMSPVAPSGASGKAKPERAVNYEAGVRYHDARGQGSVVGFASDYNRIVAPCDDGTCSASVEGQSFAGKRALIAGVEVGADYVVALPARFELPLRASYTFTHAEFMTGFQTSYQPWSAGRRSGVQAGDLMPYIPPHQLSAAAGVAYDQRVTLDLQLTFVERMREVAGQGELTPGLYTDRYAMLDAVASYTILKGLKVYLRGDNLTNSQPIVARRPFGARPLKPLLVQAGIKWEL
jgi:Fe(3+) dicitrate transport protein